MKYDYNPLWKQLEQKNFSKTDLRTRLGCSTSTLAKLSAGQTVSLDLLVNIARLLGCGLDDIVRLEPPIRPMPWEGIISDKTFCIQMIFHINTDKVIYLFGYAVPYDMPNEGMDCWYLRHSKTDTEFYVLEGCANADILQEMLKSVEKGENIGQFTDKMQIDLRPEKCKKEIADMIRSTIICNGKSVYRPPYMLPAWNVCRRLRQTFLPTVSPTDNIMLCESLVGIGKQELYYTDGKPNKDKMQKIINMLQEEFSVCHSVSDATQLGNFEVLSYPSGSYDEKCGINIKIEKGTEKEGVVQNIYLMFNSEKFKGSYICNLIAYDGSNPVIDEIYEFHCQDTNYELLRPTYQLISRIELKVWETGVINQQQRKLIYHVAHDLIMGFSIGVNIVENEFSIKDEWDQVVSHTKNIENLKPRRISHFNPDLYASTIDICEKEEIKLMKDFKVVIPDCANPDTGCFFPEGEKHQAEYLKWLKKCVNQRGVSKVILIDPYIKPKSIGAILRCAEDINQSWEIYMDSNKQGGQDRVDEIKKIKSELDLGTLPYFAIRDAKGKLHDRFIILFGENLLKVYVLSNSTDTIAEKHASVACVVDRTLSEDICRYYLEMFAKTTLEDIYISEGTRKKDSLDRKYFKDISVTLPENVNAYEKVKNINEAKKMLYLFLDEGTADLVQYYKFACLSIHSFLSQDKTLDFEFLSDALTVSEQIIKYVNFTWQLPILHNAAEILLEKELSGFLEILDRIVMSTSQVGKRDFRPGFLSIIMLFVLIEEHYNQFQEKRVLKTMLVSEYASVRALTIIQLMQQDISFKDALDTLNENLTNEELLNTIIFLLKEMQLRPKAYFIKYNKEAAPIEPKSLYPYFIQALKNLLSENESRNAVEILENTLNPLYPEYSHDIACLIDSVYNEKVIKKEVALCVYETFIIKRYEDSIKLKDDFLKTEDLMRSCEMIDYAYKVDSGVLKKIRKRMEKLERNLDGQMYSPFLKQQNYTHWKHLIDLFGCMVYLELYITKIYCVRNNSIATTEYEKICENFKTDLTKYSKIYCAVRSLVENDVFV